MNRTFTLLAGIAFSVLCRAQLYINGPLTIQNAAVVFSTDSIVLGPSASVSTEGILQSTSKINTNGTAINTGVTGFIISPVASGSAKSFDIGSGTNNRISIQHDTAAAITYKLALRNSVYQNPVTKTTTLTSNVVSRTWHVEPQISSRNTTITLFWNAADEAGSFARNNCGMARWQSGVSTSWSFLNGTNAATNTGSTPAYSRTSPTASLAPGVYYFGIGGQGSALPVELLWFDAKTQNKDGLLRWLTANELNSSHFELERNTTPDNASGWHYVSTIEAAGNSSQQQQYQYLDPKPFEKTGSATLFYRLKILDRDGSYSYSQVRSISLEPEKNTAASVSCFPNPATGLLNVVLQSSRAETLHYTLFDLNGKALLSQSQSVAAGISNTELDLHQVAAGTYLLCISNEQGEWLARQKVMLY